MQLTLDADPRVNLIRAYCAGEVQIGERVLRANCVVTADALIEDWNPTDLEPVLALQPDVLLLGRGEVHPFAPRAMRVEFESRRIALEPMTLGAACRTFNILVQEGRRVAAALIL